MPTDWSIHPTVIDRKFADVVVTKWDSSTTRFTSFRPSSVETWKRDSIGTPGESNTLNGSILSSLRLLSRAAKTAFSAEGIHILQNNDSAAGQDVFHVHFHVIPRFRGDDFETKGYEVLPLKAREEYADKLQRAVQSELTNA
jgi:hypothetical protein